MKKILFCTVVLFLVLAASVFAGRAEIDEALNSYEAVVVEAEALAQKLPFPEAGDYAAMDEKAKAAEAAIGAVADEKEWVIADAKRSTELRARFNQAVATILQNLLKY